MRKGLAILVLFIVWVHCADTSAGQAPDYERSRYNPASVYKYQELGDITILVNVWGSVGNPGLYEIPQGSRLNWLFSATGGPDIGATTWGSDERLTVRLLRADNGRSRVIFETVMEDGVYIPKENPPLQSGDILVVEKYTKPIITWRDIFPIVSATGTVISIVLALSR